MYRIKIEIPYVSVQMMLICRQAAGKPESRESGQGKQPGSMEREPFWGGKGCFPHLFFAFRGAKWRIFRSFICKWGLDLCISFQVTLLTKEKMSGQQICLSGWWEDSCLIRMRESETELF